MNNKWQVAIDTINKLDLNAIHAINVHSSRSFQERHYRLFACVDHQVVELTTEVAMLARLPLDEKRVTLIMRGRASDYDAQDIKTRLQVSTDWRGNVVVP